MSDIVLNAGSGGANLGTDQVTGTPNIDYQIVKIGYSVSGSTPVQVSTTNVLPVGFQTAQPVIQSGSWTVTANAGTGTFAISAAALPLPTGASTAAKQPALGTAGTASTDVITVQGIAGAVAIPVSGTFWQTTQPVSGTVTADQGSAPWTVKPDGTGWALTGTSANVNVTNSVAVTGTFWQATQPVSGTVTANAGTGSFTVAQATAANLNATVTFGGTAQPVLQSGSWTVAATQSGTWTVQPGNTANTTPWLVQDVPATSGGLSIFTLVGAGSNNLTLVKGSACGLYSISAQNLAATPAYLKLFNSATTGGVTPGTTAATCQYMIPGNTAGAGLVLDVSKGLDFSSGLVIMVTAGISLTDNTVVSANNQIVTLGYK